MISMHINFADRVALITGGASGIGLATAIELRSLGARVMIADIAEDGEALASTHDIHFVHADVTQEKDVINMIEKAVEKWGRLDIVVASAGIRGEQQNIEDVTPENWNAVNDLDYTGVFLTDKYAMMKMQELGTPGSIINLSSLFGLIGLSTNIAYSCAKGGLINMTRAAGTAFYGDGVRVNAVCPGLIDTAMVPLDDSASYQMLDPKHPIGTVDDVVNAIVFLASDNARFITGTTISVDGGYAAI